MIYGATGTLDIGGAADAMVHGHPNRTILVFGLVFVVSAIAFKLGAVPTTCGYPTCTTALRRRLRCS